MGGLFFSFGDWEFEGANLRLMCLFFFPRFLYFFQVLFFLLVQKATDFQQDWVSQNCYSEFFSFLTKGV